MAERIQKILARAGLASRRQAEEMIRDGRVTVNGKVARLGDTAELDKDAVKLDGRRVSTPQGPHRYLLVNKPRNVVSTLSDPQGRPTVIDLVPQSFRRGLFPVGRLDFDSEGLLLLTDDGELAQHVAHPRYGCGKTYEIKVRGVPDEAALDKLRHGIVLEGRRTAPAEITRRTGIRGSRDATTSTWWRVVLREGRTRQLRQMFLRIGCSVMRLRRVAVGPLRDRSLRRGDWRQLGEAEVELLRRVTARPKPRVTAASRPRRARAASLRSAAPRGGSSRAARGTTTGASRARSARGTTAARGGTVRGGTARSGGSARGARGGAPRAASRGRPRRPREGSPRGGGVRRPRGVRRGPRRGGGR